ncbi:MAG: putative bifunctional diguanylate cyclase/phosphodiesterase [Pseudomonadota bacterium]
MPVSDALYQHLYGIVNGMYIAIVVIVLSYALSFFGRRENRKMGVALLLAALAYAAFGFFNVFFQQFHGAATVGLMPQPLFFIAKLMVPVGLAVTTYILVKSTLLQSYDAYAMTIRWNWYIYFLYGLDLACVLVLAVTPSPWLSTLLIMLLCVPHSISGTVFCLFGLGKTMLGRLMGWMFVACSLAAIAFAGLIFWRVPVFNEPLMISVHLYFAVLVALFAFVTLRFGYDELERFFRIRGLDPHNLVHSIQQAIHGNEFSLAYQPQIDLHSGQVKGVEALLRWVHPEKGLVPPDHFIPLAEEADMIGSITRWVVDTALVENAALAQRGQPLKLSINLSPKDIHPDQVRFIGEALKRHNVPAERLVVEITENLFMEESAESREALTALQTLGVRVSLDDYGTGYSSLSYLKKLDLCEIKIDRDFVRDVTTDRTDQAIVQSTIQLGKSMGLKVVAEGAEDDASIKALRDYGCDLAQGYGIAHPMAFEALEEWIQKRPA